MFPEFREATPNHNPVGPDSPFRNDQNMKLTKFSYLLVLALALTVAASGCRKKPGYLTKIPGEKPGTVGDVGPGPAIGNGTNTPTDLGNTPIPSPDLRKDWPRDREIFKSDTVHFEFDSAVVKSADKAKVAAVAEYLKSNTQDAVEIEGHCDERGTEEYNRALGERRALALRTELVTLGIDPNRIDTISFGKDRPVDPGHDESSWKQNRRGEFILEKHP